MRTRRCRGRPRPRTKPPARGGGSRSARRPPRGGRPGQPDRSATLDERAGGEVGVEAAQAGRGGRPRVAAGLGRPRPPTSRPPAADRRGSRPAPRRRAPGSRLSTSRPVRPWSTSVREPADVGGHHRGAARRGLERHQPERLGPAGHDADVGGPVVGGEQVVRLRLDEAHPIGQAELVDQATAPGPARPARRGRWRRRRSRAWRRDGQRTARPAPAPPRRRP